jgi:lactoylglutathione lyase
VRTKRPANGPLQDSRDDRPEHCDRDHRAPQAAPYTIGSGFGHLAIGVADVAKTCERLAREGIKIPRPAGPMKHGGGVIAFVEDPDGYRIELIERA